MSRSDRSEEVGVLREAIAHIESDGRGTPSSFAGRTRTNRVALGRDTALDQALKGGLGRGALHEVVAASPGDAPAACGFTLALAARFAASLDHAAPIVWVLEDHATAETGAPYAPGLAAHGIDPARLILVRTASGPDSLWAMEEALKCKTVAAVVGEVWRLKSYDLAASRRLVLTAQKSGTPGLMLPAGAAGQARKLSSAARTRFEVRAMAGPHEASAGGRTPLPGCAAWEVRIARIRAGPGGNRFALDQDRFWPVLWDHEEAYFRDALPLPVSAPARDRPHFARAASLARSA
jgi:protein ImuA